MMIKLLSITFCLFLFVLHPNAQSETAKTEKKKNKFVMLRIYEDNDFLNFAGSGTDQYYSNGTKVDLFYLHDGKQNFFDKLLVKLNGATENMYSWGFFHRIFTPIDISKIDIQFGDRPYAGTLTVQHGLISNNPATKERLETNLGIGVIGPWAFGKEVQTWVHGLINYQKPMGWHNQISNSPIIDYQIQYEKEILKPSENLEFLGLLDAEAGTYVDNVGLGFTMRLGRFNNYFTNYEKPAIQEGISKSTFKKTQFFFYMRPVVRGVLFNTTLEGGFFTSGNDVYNIKKDDYDRVYLQYDFGFILGLKRFGFALNQKLRTQEFKGGKIQQVGNLTFFIGL